MQALHAARMSVDRCSMSLNQHTCFQVQQLMEIAPDCPELPDLLCTIRQVACAELSPQTSSFDCSSSDKPACFCKRGQAVRLGMKSAAAESLANMQMPWYASRHVEAPFRDDLQRLDACPDQAIDTAISMLEGPEDPGTCALNGSTFTVECSPIPIDLSALPPSKVRPTPCSNTVVSGMPCRAVPVRRARGQTRAADAQSSSLFGRQ